MADSAIIQRPAPQAGNKDRSSHANILPILLQLLSYDTAALEPANGRPLSVVAKDDFSFNTRVNARVGVNSH